MKQKKDARLHLRISSELLERLNRKVGRGNVSKVLIMLIEDFTQNRPVKLKNKEYGSSEIYGYSAKS